MYSRVISSIPSVFKRLPVLSCAVMMGVANAASIPRTGGVPSGRSSVVLPDSAAEARLCPVRIVTLRPEKVSAAP